MRRYADIHNVYDSTTLRGGLGYADVDQERLYRERWKGITDTQTFNQDTNLEAKFSTGVLAHKVLGGVDYSNSRPAKDQLPR